MSGGVDAVKMKGGIVPRIEGIIPVTRDATTLSPPERLYVPLIQHIGKATLPLVEVGEYVQKGQVIGDVDALVTAPVHAPVSGRVIAIEERPHPSGSTCDTVVIENDFAERLHPSIVQGASKTDELAGSQIHVIARKAGISGMGGAGFPLHTKIAGAAGKVKMLLINGCECEPVESNDDILMSMFPHRVVEGARLLYRAVGLHDATICVEEDKGQAIQALTGYIGNADDIRLLVLPTLYPQGCERMIIKAADNYEVPRSCYPIDRGYMVNNVSTVAALYDACKEGMPLVERFVTVTGSIVQTPAVYSVRIGTPFSHLISRCGILTDSVAKIVSGGSMMGIAQFSQEAPVIKTVTCLLLMSEAEARLDRSTNCIRCGRCTRVCPMRLNPCLLNFYADAKNYEELEAQCVDSCVECGSCSYCCPARLPLLQKIKLMKFELTKHRQSIRMRQRGH